MTLMWLLWNLRNTVYISLDGGATIITTTVPSSPEAGMLFYDRGNLFAQHGGGVYKLVVTYNVVTTSITNKSSDVPKIFSLKTKLSEPVQSCDKN